MITALHNIVPDASIDRWLVLLGALLVLIVSYFLFIEKESIRLGSDAVALGMVRTEGKIRRRHAGSLYWSDIRNEGKVYLRDILYTPKDSQAELVWKDKKLRLEPDSMVQLDEVTLNRIEIVLREWEQKRTPVAEVPSMDLILPKPAPIRLLPYPPSARQPFHVLTTESEINELKRLTARVEEFKSRTIHLLEVRPIQLPPRQLLRLKDFGIALLSPKEETLNLGANQWLNFTWSEIPIKGSHYVLELGRDIKFQSPLSHPTSTHTVSLQVADPGVYYWRVKAIRGSELVVSKMRTFKMVRRGGVDPFSARLPAAKPTGFLWEISSDSKFEEPLRNSVDKKPECARVGLSSGHYFCRVRDLSTNQLVKEYSFDVP